MPGKKLTTEPEETMTTEPGENTGTTTEDKPEMVKVKLFKDNTNYKDDVFVAVNGERWQIKRGVEVEVPWYVKEVLDHSEMEDQRTAQKIEEAQQKAGQRELN